MPTTTSMSPQQAQILLAEARHYRLCVLGSGLYILCEYCNDHDGNEGLYLGIDGEAFDDHNDAEDVDEQSLGSILDTITRHEWNIGHSDLSENDDEDDDEGTCTCQECQLARGEIEEEDL